LPPPHPRLLAAAAAAAAGSDVVPRSASAATEKGNSPAAVRFGDRQPAETWNLCDLLLRRLGSSAPGSAVPAHRRRSPSLDADTAVREAAVVEAGAMSREARWAAEAAEGRVADRRNEDQ